MRTGWLTRLHEWWVRLRLGAGGPMRLPPIERARWLLRLGRIRFKQGRHDEAESCSVEALSVLETVVHPDHSFIAAALQFQWQLHSTRKDLRRCAEVVERLLSLQERALGSGHRSSLYTLTQLGHIYHHLPDYEKAEGCYRRLIERLDHAGEMDFEALGHACDFLANTLASIGKNDHEVEPFYRRALTAYETASGRQGEDACRTLYNLARLCIDGERYDEAERYLTRLRAAQRRRLGRKHPELGQTLLQLGWVRLERDRYDAAENALLAALKVQEQSPESNEESVAWTLAELGRALEAQGRLAEAEERCVGAVDLLKGVRPPANAMLPLYLLQLTHLCRVQEKREKAASCIERLLQMNMETVRDIDPGWCRAELDACAAMLDGMGRAEEAEKIRREMEKLKTEPGTT